MALIRIHVTLERQAPHGIEREEHATLTRDTCNAGLISDLENFWRVVRTVASIRGWTPTLHVCSEDRSRCVALRDPPFTPSEHADSEHARSIFDALCKLTDATHRARVPSERASERASVRASTAQASADHASGTHPRARASEHPHASAEHDRDAHPRERSARASEHPQATAERESGAFPRVPPLSASTPPRTRR